MKFQWVALDEGNCEIEPGVETIIADDFTDAMAQISYNVPEDAVKISVWKCDD